MYHEGNKVGRLCGVAFLRKLGNIKAKYVIYCDYRFTV